MAQILYYVLNKVGHLVGNIFFKFEPNLTTFYYIQIYERKTKGLLECILVHSLDTNFSSHTAFYVSFISSNRSWLFHNSNWIFMYILSQFSNYKISVISQSFICNVMIKTDPNLEVFIDNSCLADLANKLEN